MAVQMATFLSGKIGNVVFIKRNGKYYARSRRTRIRQTAPTKRCSGNFGRASSMGSTLRRLLEPVLPFPKSTVMQRGFSGSINRWFKYGDTGSLVPQTRLPAIQDFSFNEATGIAERWKLPLTVTRPNDELLELQVPAFIPHAVIHAPASTHSIECVVMAASTRLGKFPGSSTVPFHFNIPYTNELVPAQTISLPLTAASGWMVVTVVSFTYLDAAGNPDKRPEFMPSSVIDARYC